MKHEKEIGKVNQIVTCILGRSDCDCIAADIFDMFDICHAQKYASGCHNINFHILKEQHQINTFSHIDWFQNSL